MDSRPDVDVEQLSAVRFPVIFFGGEETTIDSAAEHLRTDPVPPPTPVTLESVIGMWQHLVTMRKPMPIRDVTRSSSASMSS